MRRKLITIAAIIILLLLSFWGFLEYRQYASYRVPILSDANAILKVNVDGLIKTIISENIFSTTSEKDSSAKEVRRETANTGLKFPANIFIYTTTERKSTTLFCTLPLKDKWDFKQFAEKELSAVFNDSGEGKAFDNKLSLLISDTYVFLAWSQEKENLLPVLRDLATGKNVLDKQSDIVQQLKKSRSHFTVVTKEGNLRATISRNELKAELSFLTDKYFDLSRPFVKRKSVAGGIGSFYCNAKPVASLFDSSFTIKNYTFETDSLLAGFGGYADIHITDTRQQTDTVITYEYDDNFQKKEIKTTNSYNAPAGEVAIKATENLVRYLQEKNVLSDHRVNKELFPLYTLMAASNQQTLFLSTDTTDTVNGTYEDSSNFMELQVDFTKIRPLTDSSYIASYVKDLDKIYFTGKATENKRVAITGRILFKQDVFKTLPTLITDLFRNK